jgi:copper chaperone CopZ
MKKKINIEGMTCGHCSARVKKALEQIEGVESADVSAEDKRAMVTLSHEVQDEKFISAVDEVGYKVVSVE